VNNRKTGAKGEKLAAAYLELIGYEILETNYHASIRGELDIIAQQENTLVFVEVKLRLNDAYGTGRDAVDTRKMNFMSYAAQHYITGHGLHEMAARFDVIVIQKENGKIIIDHIKNAFDCITHKGW